MEESSGMVRPTRSPFSMWELGEASCSRSTVGDVPFTIQNYAYTDPLGRETVTWVRTFTAHKTRRFDAYMIYSEQRGCIVDYVGNAPAPCSRP